MSKNLEIKTVNGDSFLILENIPAHEAVKYMNKGDYLTSSSSTTRYVINYREFEQYESGNIQVKINLAPAK